MSSKNVISIKNLSKCYHIYQKPIDRILARWMPWKKRDFWALQNIDFSIGKGETVAIIGKNGSGKSTLLQLICGTLQATSGEVRVQGRIAALLELGAGFDLESTGRENVYINGMLLGMTQVEIRREFDKIEAFADIGDFIDQPVKTYSSGMFVRLAFAVIAHASPDILIIDEALAVGDIFFVQKCMRFIREFKKKGTILFVSHDTSAVTSLCDRAVWLDNGQMKMLGSAKEVSERYLAFQHAKDRSSETGEEILDKPNYNREAILSTTTNIRDCRQDMLNDSNLKNEIRLVELGSANNGYGTGKAKITHVNLLQDGQSVASIIGGENVSLEIVVDVSEQLESVIAGFYFKDRLGQRLFGDNTYLSYLHEPISVTPGELMVAIFKFRMPILPVGDYSIDVALASGDQDNHTQHHWIHDAATFKSLSSSVASGLVGIPMESIKFLKANDGV